MIWLLTNLIAFGVSLLFLALADLLRNVISILVVLLGLLSVGIEWSLPGIGFHI